MQIRINQIVKTEFLLQYALNLNGFHIVTADQSYVLLPLAVLCFWHLCRPCFYLLSFFYKDKYINNDHLTWILIGKMSGAH